MVYDFKDIEEEISKRWKEKKIYEKVKKSLSKSKKKFYFMDGPPYATGHIHMGTALNKILKDIAIRSQRMQKKDVFDRPGYDTHGIPIEFGVEKEIGVQKKQDIEKFGVKKFVERCRKFATKYIDVMNKEFENLGVWMDWKNPYLTLDNNYIESIWWTFKKAYEKNLLYLGKYPVHICPRCGTAVAYNEIIYREQEDNSIYVKFPMKEKNKFLIIWTTTPWTLPGNTAVMVNPDFEYAEAKMSNGEIWIIAKELAKNFFAKKEIGYKIERIFRGKELEGKEYINPLAKYLNLPKLKNAYKIILSKRYVTLDAGTGLVHSAPGHGKEDYDASKDYDMDILSPVNIDGKMTKEAGKYAGGIARKIDSEIIRDLEKDGYLILTEKYSHEYPLCWRCTTPLLMLSVPQWFFRISSIHSKLLKENENVNWIPEWGKDRMKAWLEGISDWPISRSRYWGTPLPIWICKKCEDKLVIEGIKELEKLSGRKINQLHKPEIDEIEIKCKKCGGVMKRTPEVLDVWFDSGVSSWAALDFPKEKNKFKKFWPAELNLEGTDQFRGWWNSQIILSEIAFEKKPFENIYVHGMVLDLGKKKMSKSLGNVVSPREVIEKYGKDAMRYYMSTINPGENVSYDESYFKEIEKFFNILVNIQNLINTEYKMEFKEKSNPKKTEDKWIISKLNNLAKEVNENYNKYLFCKNTKLISKFILEDVSRKYIKIVRERINEKDKNVRDVLNNIFSNVVLLSAPIIPYIADYLYIKMKGKKESIHLCSFLKPDIRKINKKLEDEMENVLKIIEAGLRERDKIQIGLKWPLQTASISYYKPLEDKKFEEIIKSQLNVKELEYLTGSQENISVELDTKITSELEAEGYARELMRKTQAFRKKEGLIKTDKIKLAVVSEKNILQMFEKHKQSIKEKTNAKELQFIDARETNERFILSLENYSSKSEDKIKEIKIEILLKKI